MEPPAKCASCGETRFYAGSLFEAISFVPDQGRRFFSLGPVSKTVKGFACAACGVVTLKVDAEDLRTAMKKLNAY